ncbi:transporter substrate-binding domain-containing protein [uncultured Halopseudomonas sp.]|uniref:substrate-binding periplasmic protein n=1 Tax=uncultured Halopseudomonas sp. TaxID=2901193 RepID=UPI0030EDB71A|tara:strand:- start:39250 stop:40041 length:792 start_codon:yes stop_codon:yes gene_type:complete
MRNLLLLCCLVLGTSGVLANEQDNLEVSPALTPSITDNTRQLLRVGMIDFPPYSFLDETGQPAGMFIPLINKIAEKAGYQTEYLVLPIARLVQNLQDGTVHIWPGVEGKPELAEHTWVSRQLLGYVSINLYFRDGTPAPAWPEDLRHENLIMLTGYDYWPSLFAVIDNPANGIRVQRTHSHRGAIGMLERNRARFLLNYGAPMQQALRMRPDLKLNNKPLHWVPLRMIVSRQSSMGSQSLLEKLDLSYQELMEEGEDLSLPSI